MFSRRIAIRRRSLCASYIGIGDDVLREMIEVLKNSERPITEVLLGGNMIDDLSPLAKGLRYIPSSVRILDLSYNRISNLSPIVNGLRFNVSLEELYLSKNRISDLSHLIELMRMHTLLKKLSLCTNLITDIALLSNELPFMKSIEEIDLSCNHITNALSLVEAIQCHCSLGIVCFDHNPVDSEISEHIHNIASINLHNIPLRTKSLFDILLPFIDEFTN